MSTWLLALSVCTVLLTLVSCGSIRFKTSPVLVEVPIDSSGLDTIAEATKKPNTSSTKQNKSPTPKDTSSVTEADSLDGKQEEDTGPKPLVCTVNPGTMAGSGNSDEVRLKGNVTCLYEDVELKTKEAIWNQEKETVYCLGGMDVQSNGYTLQADKGEYDRLETKILAYGRVYAEDDEKEHVFFAEELEYNQKTKDMKWMGNANFVRTSISKKDSTQGDSTTVLPTNTTIDTLKLRADTIRYNDSIKAAEAIQNVVLDRGKLTVQSEYGRYDQKKEKVTMTGNPQATIGESRMNGEFMYVDLKGQEVLGVSLQGDAVGNFVEKNKNSVETYTLQGDSLYMKLLEDYLETVDILKENTVGKVQHESSKYPGKVNEMLGDTLKLSFEKKKIQEAWIQGDASYLYYLYDKGVYQGKNEAKGQEIRITFKQDRLQQVNIQGNANGAYWGKGQTKSTQKKDSVDVTVSKENSL